MLLTSTSVVALVAGCSYEEPPAPGSALLYAKKNASKSITADAFGEVPGGLIDPKAAFIPLLTDSGGTSRGKVVRNTTVVTDVSKGEKCQVKSGSQVLFVAQNGKYVRVLTPASCAGQAGEVEGFLALADVVAVEEEASNNSENARAAAPNGSADENSVWVANGAPAAPQSAPQRFPGCSKVGYAVGDSGDEGVFAALASTSGKNLVPGDLFRNPKKHGSLRLDIKGEAPQWRINVPGVGEATLDASKYKKSDKQYVIPAGDFLRNNDKRKSKEEFIVQGLNPDGSNAGGECRQSIQLVSPLVLDLAGAGLFEGVSLAESRVSFDIGATGLRPRMGWLKPTMGLLALDRNGNGRVDDGSELFGEAFAFADGKLATNGYAALASLDANGDWAVDSSDPMFARLQVWVDANGNGVTDLGELRSLASLQIHRLGVAYSPSFRHGPRALFDNDVRYEARFWGPARCGDTGCLSFDVYFATSGVVANR
jgi:hypothetical protein